MILRSAISDWLPGFSSCQYLNAQGKVAGIKLTLSYRFCLSAKCRKGFLNRFGGSFKKRTYAAKKIGIDSKPMDKSCRVYGNFHSDNRAVKCGTPDLYRSRKSILKSGTWSHRMPVWAILINYCNRTQYKNMREVCARFLRVPHSIWSGA